MKDATFSSARLLSLYDRISDAPDAIPRLRSYVLDLAVRGKLVEQDAGDEPAVDLLKRIAADKTERAVSARDRRATKITPLVVDEGSSPIPWNWVWALFGDLVISRDGERIPVSREEREQRAKVYDYYGASGIIDKIDGFLFDKPLLLIGEDGANLINRSTPIAFIARGQYWVNNHAHVLDGLSEKFLRYVELFINATDLKPYVTGTAQPKMNQAKMNSIPVALPPLAEQHRIVAKVDELMALCDQLEQARAGREAVRDRLTTASLARLTAPETDAETYPAHARFALQSLPALTTRPDQIKTLRQTILNLAVRGKLVAQDAADEPAAELLKRVGQEIAGYSKSNRIGLTLPSPVSDDEKLFAVPDGWQWTRLCGLFNVITDGDHQPPPKADEGVAFLTIGNVTTGKLDFDGCRIVPQAYFEGLAPYRTPAKGDILYTVVGATYGRPALVDADRAFCVQRHIAIMKPSTALNLRFLLILLGSPLIYDQATNGATGTAQPTIALRPLRNFVAALPPLAEQHRIVSRVDALMALCDQLDASLTTAATTRLDALLHEALEPGEPLLEPAE